MPVKRIFRVSVLTIGIVCCFSPFVALAQATDSMKFKDDWNDADIVNPAKSSAPIKVVPAPHIDVVPVQETTNTDAVSESDGWPTELPRLKSVESSNSPRRTPLKVEVSESVSAITSKIAELKKEPSPEVYEAANSALAQGNYELAIPLYELLCSRAPDDPRYFYGAGIAEKMSGNLEESFPNLLLAWHLGASSVYQNEAQSVVGDLQKKMDDTFKLTFNWQRSDPETVLNAGTRIWKMGLTKQSVQLFEYSLKNQPLYRAVAAYDLGAVAEHNGDLKLALNYYKYALKQQNALEAYAESHPEYAGAVEKTFTLCPKTYIEQAAADVQNDLKAGASGWNGWAQASSYPQHWGSEVCPLCAISRTSIEYKPGQMQLR